MLRWRPGAFVELLTVGGQDGIAMSEPVKLGHNLMFGGFADLERADYAPALRERNHFHLVLITAWRSLLARLFH
jgi:hypothetical protein